MVYKARPVYAVILVGGKGKRLRPLSSSSRPKAFLSVTKDGKTMFARTLARIRKIVPDDRILVVANKAHAGLVRRDFPGIKRENLVLEPVSRNTAPAITLAAVLLSRRDEDALLAVLPTDQYIAEEGRYIDSIKKAIDFVKGSVRSLVVMGVEPESPSTELGYVKLKGRGSAFKEKNIFKVERFTEKPGEKTAKRYIKSGRYLWNTGAFIFRADAFLSAVRKFAPVIYKGLRNPGNLANVYKNLPAISVDYAVMEKSVEIYCVKGGFGWSDMGSFENLASVLRRESRRFVLRRGRIVKII